MEQRLGGNSYGKNCLAAVKRGGVGDNFKIKRNCCPGLLPCWKNNCRRPKGALAGSVQKGRRGSNVKSLRSSHMDRVMMERENLDDHVGCTEKS